MDEARLRQILPRISKDALRLNADRCAPRPEPKHGSGDGSLAAGQTQAGDTGKRAVRITSYRVRLCDPDNLVGKWHLDALRYAGCLRGDTAEDITYQISQKKVSKKSEQKTLIEVETL